MGLNSKSGSDPDLAATHDAGSKVTVLQILEHARLGTVALPYTPNLWAVHHGVAEARLAVFGALKDRLVEFPVGSHGMRTVYEDEYLREIYVNGSIVAVNACLAIQHLCLAIENSAQEPLGSGPLTDRLRDAAGAVGIVDIVRGVGYDAFVEVQRIRDAIEHPKPDNTHRGGDDGSWDQVPMAWLLSERAEESFGQFFDWFDRVHDAWQAWVAAQPPVTQTLTVERGRKSLRQYKKPPRPAPEG